MPAQIDTDYIKTRPFKLYNRLISYLFFEGRPLTTKGQWINPLLFALFSIEKRLPAPKRVKEPIFVIGTGRSGTTILGVVLSMHREVGFLNEPKALWHSAFNEEDLIGSYSSRPARYYLAKNDVTPQVKESMHRFFGWYLFFSRSRRVVDKYPELIFRVSFVREIFPDAKFLFLVRNGWDTCHSIDAWSKRLGSSVGGKTHDWWGLKSRKWRLLTEQVLPQYPDLATQVEIISSFNKHSDMAAVEWILTMREGLRISSQFPDSVHTVIYENLVTNPRESLQSIAQFCGLGNDPVFLDYGERTLSPVKPKPPYDLHPAICVAFSNTMRDLGYKI